MSINLTADYLIVRKYLLSQIILCVVVFLLVGIGTKNIGFVAGAIPCVFTFSMMFTLFATDDLNQWQQFRLTLPVTRKSMVLQRYVWLLIFSFVGFVISFIVVGVLAQALEIFPVLVQYLGEIDESMGVVTLLTVAGGTAVGLLTFSILIPCISRFGLTQAVRLAPLLLAFAPTLILFTIGGDALMESLEAFNQFVFTPGGLPLLMACLLGVLIIVCAVSCFFAIKLFEKREF